MSLTPCDGARFCDGCVQVPYSYKGLLNSVAKYLHDNQSDRDGAERTDNGFKLTEKAYMRVKEKVDPFDYDISKVPIRTLQTKWLFDGTYYRTRDLRTQMKFYAEKHNLKRQLLKKDAVSLVEDTLYFGVFGALIYAHKKIEVVAFWNSFVLTLFGSTLVVHKDYDSVRVQDRKIVDSEPLNVDDGMVAIQISKHELYHGALFTEDQIVAMISNQWNGSHQLVVSKPQERKKICTTLLWFTETIGFASPAENHLTNRLIGGNILSIL